MGEEVDAPGEEAGIVDPRWMCEKNSGLLSNLEEIDVMGVIGGCSSLFFGVRVAGDDGVECAVGEERESVPAEGV